MIMQVNLLRLPASRMRPILPIQALRQQAAFFTIRM
jgi:hypothetical protein